MRYPGCVSAQLDCELLSDGGFLELFVSPLVPTTVPCTEKVNYKMFFIETERKLLCRVIRELCPLFRRVQVKGKRRDNQLPVMPLGRNVHWIEG